MTAKRAIGIYTVVQDMNSIREPTLAIAGKKKRIYI